MRGKNHHSHNPHTDSDSRRLLRILSAHGCYLPDQDTELLREELGVEISVVQLLPSVKHVGSDHAIKLIPFICTIREGEISLTEHRMYRWVHRSQLDQLDWLEADVEVIEILNQYN